MRVLDAEASDLKTITAVLVTDGEHQPALLSIDDASNDEPPVLIVEGVAHTPEDLPAGAYLIVPESDMAERAALAGFVIEPPHTVKRRTYRIVGKFSGVVLLLCAVGSLVWAVRDALELDLPGALSWVGLSVFLGLLGLFWWTFGDEYMLWEDAVNRSRARRLFGSRNRRR